MILRHPLEHMGARGSMFGHAERYPVLWKSSRLNFKYIGVSLCTTYIQGSPLVQVYTGGFQAGLPHGSATLEIPGVWRS